MRAAERAGLSVERAASSLSARLNRILASANVDLILDVGANRGQYARRLRRYGYRGRIVSFEPLSEPFRGLGRASSGDPEWDTLRLALSDTAGEMRLHVASNAGASSSALEMAPALKAASAISYTGEEVVQARRLDDVFSTVRGQAQRPFLKMDVQGLEPAILEGAHETLPALVGIQTEMSVVPLYEGEQDYRQRIGDIASQGFSLVHLEPGFWDRETGRLLQFDAVFMRGVEDL